MVLVANKRPKPASKALAFGAAIALRFFAAHGMA